jgi:hypothetical protein
MPDKKFASPQTSPGKGDSPDKPKEASPAGEPTVQPVQPDQKPAVIAPAPKS